ncbi:hypothetical protein D915_002430 [Fasciola hepatica]|uniref:Uncharacterized protein n=1 Tax=Fasciola hepatica TaxID=6192 RepID=A0A4E0RDC9_FASHE|nr:hypothetical protein D915_002430 [Fasciola hepatica]
MASYPMVLICGLLFFCIVHASIVFSVKPLLVCRFEGVVYNRSVPIKWQPVYWKHGSPKYKWLNKTLCTSVMNALRHNVTLKNALQSCEVTEAKPGSVIAYSAVLFDGKQLSRRGIDYRKPAFRKALISLIRAYPSYVPSWFYYGKVKSLKCKTTRLEIA